MKDRSNIIKEAIEYRDKLEKKVEELAQSVVRLQISLDFADNTIKKKDRENAELKAENDTLKSQLDFEVQKKEVFETKNEQLKEKIKNFEEVVKLCRCEQYQQTLQEIKAIAELPKPFKDFSEIKTATEVEYDYAAICNELELRLHKVLELITKAESEG